jgi:hypothetical protein
VKFSEVARRLTGISTPIFGVSWDPGQADVAVARRVIRFMEDRRVMFNVTALEIPEHCVLSVIQVRHFLTAELGNLAEGHAVAPHLQAMRAACRRFVDTAQEIKAGTPGTFGALGAKGNPSLDFRRRPGRASSRRRHSRCAARREVRR